MFPIILSVKDQEVVFSSFFSIIIFSENSKRQNPQNCGESHDSYTASQNCGHPIKLGSPPHDDGNAFHVHAPCGSDSSECLGISRKATHTPFPQT